ncbi:hypothetical protein SGLAM104S_10334 [Streptomyces glaucescens]
MLTVLLTVSTIGWGMFVRSKRQLMLSLRDRARRAETEARLRAEQAQRLAREAIAREMHDVLAHRLTLLSVHAGALEFRPDASREEITRCPSPWSSANCLARPNLHRRGVPRLFTETVAPTSADSGQDAITRLGAYLTQLIEDKRRAGPGDDLLSALIQTTTEDGDRLSPEELRGMAYLLLLAAHGQPRGQPPPPTVCTPCSPTPANSPPSAPT